VQRVGIDQQGNDEKCFTKKIPVAKTALGQKERVGRRPPKKRGREATEELNDQEAGGRAKALDLVLYKEKSSGGVSRLPADYHHCCGWKKE